jgi:hypothetical protein
MTRLLSKAGKSPAVYFLRFALDVFSVVKLTIDFQKRAENLASPMPL